MTEETAETASPILWGRKAYEAEVRRAADQAITELIEMASSADFTLLNRFSSSDPSWVQAFYGGPWGTDKDITCGIYCPSSEISEALLLLHDKFRFEEKGRTVLFKAGETDEALVYDLERLIQYAPEVKATLAKRIERQKIASDKLASVMGYIAENGVTVPVQVASEHKKYEWTVFENVLRCDLRTVAELRPDGEVRVFDRYHMDRFIAKSDKLCKLLRREVDRQKSQAQLQDAANDGSRRAQELAEAAGDGAAARIGRDKWSVGVNANPGGEQSYFLRRQSIGSLTKPVAFGATGVKGTKDATPQQAAEFERSVYPQVAEALGLAS